MYFLFALILPIIFFWPIFIDYLLEALRTFGCNIYAHTCIFGCICIHTHAFIKQNTHIADFEINLCVLLPTPPHLLQMLQSLSFLSISARTYTGISSWWFCNVLPSLFIWTLSCRSWIYSNILTLISFLLWNSTLIILIWSLQGP